MENNNKLEEVGEMLKQNLEASWDIQRRIVKLENYVKWQKIGIFLKILLIVVPVVLSIIYLPSLFREAFKNYQDLLGSGNSFSNEYKPLGL